MKEKMIRKIKNVFKIITNKESRFEYITSLGFFNYMKDEVFLKIKYKIMMGKKLNLDTPITFDEKLQWLKLFDRNPIYTTMVDKEAVKEYVSNLIGKEYVIPTLQVWDKVRNIDISKLPNQFVLKCTHDSGGVIICKDKEKFNIKKAKRKLNKCMKRNYYWMGREWPYKNVQPRIIAERYMEDNSDGELRDYKFYCFSGHPRYLLLATNRQSENNQLCFDYFDMEFKHLNLVNFWHPNAQVMPHRPKNYDKMIELAKILSAGLPHVRVDFY